MRREALRQWCSAMSRLLRRTARGPVLPSARERAALLRLGCLLNGAPEQSARASYRHELIRGHGTQRQEQAYWRYLREGCQISLHRIERIVEAKPAPGRSCGIPARG